MIQTFRILKMCVCKLCQARVYEYATMQSVVMAMVVWIILWSRIANDDVNDDDSDDNSGIDVDDGDENSAAVTAPMDDSIIIVWLVVLAGMSEYPADNTRQS